MTATSTAAKTGSNGKAAATADGKSYERSRGMARVREEECWHLASLAEDALREAQRLADQVHQLGSNRVIHYDDDKGCQPIDWAKVAQMADEARRCATVAVQYLDSLGSIGDPWAQGSPF